MKKYRYLVVDGELNGTGIRDFYNHFYINPADLDLDKNTIERLNKWLLNYSNLYYEDFANEEKISDLDLEGKSIASLICENLPNSKVIYYSSAKMMMDILNNKN